MLTQTHVASSCGLVSVARAREGEGGCSAGLATFSLSLLHCQARCKLSLDSSWERKKNLLLGRFCFSFDTVSGTSLTGDLALHTATSSPCSRVRPPWPLCQLVGLQPSVPPPPPHIPAMTGGYVIGSDIQDQEFWFLTGLMS